VVANPEAPEPPAAAAGGPPDTPSRLDAAREVTAALLNAIEITRVILVDDQAGPRQEPVRTALAAGKTIDIPGAGTPPADASVVELSDWLREHWEELDSNQRRAVYSEALRAVADDPTYTATDPELPSFEVLSYVMADRLAMVTPDEWADEQDELIGDGPDDGVLVLFDLVLGGEREGGMNLLRDLRSRRPEMLGAIITSSVDANRELETQARLAKDHDVAPDSLLLSSKEHLTREGCMRFVDLLRITANSRRLHALRDHVAETAEHYGQQARRRLAEFDDRVLEDIVFRSSHVEGAWEVDSLLRVLNILQREASRTGQLDRGGPSAA